MKRSCLLLIVCCTLAASPGILAEVVSVRHRQGAMQRSMVARSESGKIIGNAQFSQEVQGDQVTMRLKFVFLDGSIDDETTTYTQHGTFGLVRNHHIQSGPSFAQPVDFSIDSATGIATSRTTDKDGKVNVASERIDMPKDLANGLVGTLLLNVPPDAPPFRVGILVPFDGGRLIRILISSVGEQTFQAAGQTHKARVFRIHPELGRIVGMLAAMIGLQPKDLMVWVLEGDQPEIVRTVGQLGGYGPLVSFELEGTSFPR